MIRLWPTEIVIPVEDLTLILGEFFFRGFLISFYESNDE